MQTQTAEAVKRGHEAAEESTRHKDKWRPGKWLRVHVTARTGGHIVGQHIVGKGTSEAIVHEDDLATIMEQVETEPHKIEVAEQAFQAEVDRACAEHKGPRAGAELREYMLASINSSPGAWFRILFNRDIRPFLKVEVIETLPPEQNWNNATADAMAGQVNAGFAAVMAPLVKTLENLAEATKRGK